MKNHAVTVGMVSLGCSKNKVDAEVMLAKLSQAGYALTMDPAGADVIIVNTCGFINDAKVESVNAILEMAEYKKGRCQALIVSGCLTARYPGELWEEIPEADALLGVSQYPEIVSVVEKVLEGKRIRNTALDCRLAGSPERILTTPPWMGYLKIAEGCDNRCSFCAIPDIRGPYRSRPLEELVEEAQWMAAQGVRELILIAQDTTRYGMDLYGAPSLPRLLEAVCQVEGIRWVRTLYCYPEMVDEALLDTMRRQEKICDYLDIPLQHCQDTILEAMNRRSSAKQIEALMERIRSLPERFALRTTMIVGFPGEQEDDFEALMDFVERHPFDHLGAFTYSAEEGTPAADRVDQVDEDEKARRLDRLMQAQQAISRRQLAGYVGETLEVLVEEALPGGRYVGRTRYQAPDIDGVTRFTGPQGLEPGSLVRVRITASREYDLEGALEDVAGQ